MTALSRAADLRGRRVLVAGAGVSGPGAVRLLLRLGAHVSVTDNRADALTQLVERVHAAESADAVIDLLDSDAAVQSLHPDDPHHPDLVVTSPGWRPDTPLLQAALAAEVPVWGDVQLSWLADQEGLFGAPRRWLAVTGTNGKTTTTSMLADMLAAAGFASAACGNIGTPIPDVLLAEPRIEYLAAELSSFQLHWAPACTPHCGAVLNIAEDHLDWHGSMQAYTAAKAQVLNGEVAVVGLDDPNAAALLDTAQAPRRIAVTLAEPDDDQLGVRNGELIDAAFSAPPASILPATEVTPPGPAGVTDALVAAALARAVGVSVDDIATALRAFTAGAHRAVTVGTVHGIRYVDDSKATNPHAARTSLLSGGHHVWIAGGLLKGAHVDALVAEVAPILRGVVLIGRDRAQIAEALQRHAPQVPVIDLPSGDDNHEHTGTTLPDPQPVMERAVRAATEMALQGDTVTLAPAAASMDMFRNYGHRGDSFASAVEQLAAEEDNNR